MVCYSIWKVWTEKILAAGLCACLSGLRGSELSGSNWKWFFFFSSLSLSLEFRFSWAHTWAVIIASGSHPPSSSSLPSGINRCMTDNSPNWTEGFFGQWSPHPPDIPVSPPASVPCLGNIWDQTRVRASEGKYFSDQRLLIFTLEPLPPKFYLSHLKPNVAQEYLGAYSPTPF